MVDYRAYILGADGHIQARREFAALDDLAAISHARRWVDGHDVEVWQFERAVAKLTVDGKSSGLVSIVWSHAKSGDPKHLRHGHPCPACGVTMHFTRAEPHPRYSNLDERFFECACGQKLSEIVTRRD